MHRHTKNLSSQKYKYNIEIPHQHTAQIQKKHSIHLNYILYIVTAEQQQTRTDMQLPGQLYPKCDLPIL